MGLVSGLFWILGQSEVRDLLLVGQDFLFFIFFLTGHSDAGRDLVLLAAVLVVCIGGHLSTR